MDKFTKVRKAPGDIGRRRGKKSMRREDPEITF